MALGERVIRFKLDFGNAQQESRQVQQSMNEVVVSSKAIDSSFKDNILTIVKFVGAVGTLIAAYKGLRLVMATEVFTRMTAVITATYMAFKRWADDSQLFQKIKNGIGGVLTSLGATDAGKAVLATFDKLKTTVASTFASIAVSGAKSLNVLKAGMTALGQSTLMLSKQFHVLELGILAYAGPLGKLVTHLADVGIVAGLAAAGLGNFSGALGLTASVLAKVSAASFGAIAAINAMIFAVGALADAIGNKLVASASHWLEIGIEFQKQQFGLEIAVRGFQKATEDTSVSADDLVKKIRAISAETGLGAAEIKQGVNVMFEMSRVTKLTGEQIDTLLKSMADFSVVRGVSFQEVVYAIDQSFRGWHQSAGALGLTLDDASVRAEAAKHGFVGMKDGIDLTADTTARFNAVMEQMSFALGASALSATKNLDGAIRKLTGEVQLFMGTLGEGVANSLLPFYKILVDIVVLINRSVSPDLLKTAGAIVQFTGVALKLIGIIAKWGSAFVFVTSGIKILQFGLTQLGKTTTLVQLIQQFLQLEKVSKFLSFFGVSSGGQTAKVVADFLKQISTLSGALKVLSGTLIPLVINSLKSLAVALALPLLKLTLIVGSIYVLVKAFQLVEAHTKIFSTTWAEITKALSGAQGPLAEIGNALAKAFSTVTVELIKSIAILIIGLAFAASQAAKSVEQLALSWLEFKKAAFGSDNQAQIDEIRKKIASLDVFQDRLAKGAKNIAEGVEAADESMVSYSEAAQAAHLNTGNFLQDFKLLDTNADKYQQALEKLKFKRDLLGGNDIADAAEQWTLLLGRLKEVGVTQDELNTIAERYWTNVARNQRKAVAEFGDALGLSRQLMHDEITERVDTLRKANVAEETILKIRNLMWERYENQRKQLIADSINDRISAERDANIAILSMQGDVAGAETLTKEQQQFQIRRNLAKELNDIKLSGLEVDQRSSDATRRANAELIKSEIESFERRKQNILGTHNLYKDTLNEIVDLQVDTYQRELGLNDASYLAEKVGFERRRELLAQETQDRILQIKTSKEFAGDTEHFITLAHERESLRRRQLDLEEAEARRRAISTGAAAARGFNIAPQKSDLEIIKENRLRSLSFEEEEQIFQSQEDRKLQKKIDQIRNPLGDFTVTAIDSVNQIREEYMKIQQANRAAVDSGLLSATQANTEIQRANQAFYQRLINEAGQAPLAQRGIFTAAAAQLPQGLLDAQSIAQAGESPGDRARRELLERNTKVLEDLNKAILDLTLAIVKPDAFSGPGAVTAIPASTDFVKQKQAEQIGALRQSLAKQGLGLAENAQIDFPQETFGAAGAPGAVGGLIDAMQPKQTSQTAAEMAVANVLAVGKASDLEARASALEAYNQQTRAYIDTLSEAKPGTVTPTDMYAAQFGARFGNQGTAKLPESFPFASGMLASPTGSEMNIAKGLEAAPTKVQQVVKEINDILKDGVGQWEETLANTMSEKIAQVWKRKLQDIIMAS